MWLLTPSRLRALTWWAGLVTLVLMTEGTCGWYLFSDRDSVPQLTEARACELAAVRAVNGPRKWTCKVVTQTPEWMQVHVEQELAPNADLSSRVTEVCFLKANRWFVVLAGPDAECPHSGPHELKRITSLRDEEKVEQAWASTTTALLESKLRGELMSALRDLAVRAREDGAPQKCVADQLPATKALVLDVRRLNAKNKAWHYLSSDELEDAVSDAPRAPAMGLRRRAPLVALVDLREFQAPEGQNVGYAEGTLSLVDWPNHRVLCSSELNLHQPESAPRDLSVVEPLLPDFKDRLYSVVRDQVAFMTDAAVDVRPLY